MPKKIVIKVSITCEKCKTCILRAVAKLEGINTMTLDSDNNTLTVVGDVDPVLLLERLRKSGKGAALDSVEEDKQSDGGNPGGEEAEQGTNKDGDETKPPSCYYPYPYGMPIGYAVYDEPNRCTIL